LTQVIKVFDAFETVEAGIAHLKGLKATAETSPTD